MASQLKGKWHSVCHGDWEGEWRVAKGRITYIFERDKFQVYDNQGQRVFFGDDGWELERWLIKNGWVPPSALSEGEAR